MAELNGDERRHETPSWTKQVKDGANELMSGDRLQLKRQRSPFE